ncbi:MAG TPA: hypothetical protein VGA80_06075 [Flavobacteriaceae bacterium]|jgi:hypothetical protein
MKKTTQNLLSKRLTQYGTLSLALAGIAEADGQIVYTDIDPDHNQGMGSYLLNVNSDGTLSDGVDDFEIFIHSTKDLRIKPLVANNEVLGDFNPLSGTTYVFPYALNSGAVISNSAGGSWFDNGYFTGVQDLNYDSGARGHWVNVADKYLGLRFKIGSDTHYGWARMSVGTSGDTWVIKDYAYNATPDESINAGQKTLAIGNNELAKVKIVSLNKSIGLYNLPERTQYNVFSLTGQLVLKGDTTGHSYVVEANTVSKGIYVIELIDSSTNAVMRKKIIL